MCGFSATSHVALNTGCAMLCIGPLCTGLFVIESVICYLVWRLCGSMWYPSSLNLVCTCVSKHSHASIYVVVTCTTCTTHTNYIFYITCPLACMCAQVVICYEPIHIVQCRMDLMPLMRVLSVAILLLRSTLPPSWRATSLTQMRVDAQPCTWQPILGSCPWWSTLWDPVDLTWMHGTRLVHICACCMLVLVMLRRSVLSFIFDT